MFGDIAGSNAAKAKAAAGTLSPQDSEFALSRVMNDLLPPASSNVISQNETSRRLLHTLQKLMWRDVGVLRDTEKLRSALSEIRRIRKDVLPSIRPKHGMAFNTSLMSWLDLRNSLLCAEAICLAQANGKKAEVPNKWKIFPLNG